MKFPIYQIDAFTDRLFGGNPAAVCPLQQWLDDDLLQSIASENNLSETAFFVREGDAFKLRWFTPTTEVKLCGHATLASAYLLFELLSYEQATICFNTLSGKLLVTKLDDGRLQMDFPAQPLSPLAPSATELDTITNAIGAQAVAISGGEDLLVELANEQQVCALAPDFGKLAALPYRGIIVTARGQQCDFVSRFFAPAVGVDEDPVTGSAHTKLMPYWAAKLEKSLCQAQQLSRRGGQLECELVGERVMLRGQAKLYMHGSLCL